MPTSAAVPPTAAAADNQSPNASDSEEYEYEEIEIEEEIEVEEEVSDEDEEEEKESGADFLPPIEDGDHEKRKRTLIDDDDMMDDDKAPKFDGEMMNAETSNPFNESSKEVTGGDSVTGLNEANKIPHSEEETKQTSAHDDKAPKFDGGMMNAETSNPFNESSKEVTGGDSVIGLNEAHKIPQSVEETMQTSAQDINDKQQKEPRLDVPLIRPRSLSPAMEMKEGNKRPALICDFFAKGWCIKGNSCRFRHIRDPMNVGDQQKESSVAGACQKSELWDDEGSRESVGRSALAGSPGLVTSAAAPTTCPSKMIQVQESKESPRHKSKSEESQKENPVTISSFNDLGTESQRDNQYLDTHNPPVNADGSLRGTSSNSPFMGSDIHRSNWISSYATRTEELGGRGNEFGLHYQNMPTINYSLNYSLSSSQLMTRTSPSNHSSIWPRTSMLFSSSSWKSDSVATLKHFGGDRELHPSLRPSVSPFSGSESEHLYHTKVSDVPLHSAGFATKFSSYDWEPSKPFQSSFLLSQGISSPGSQYDPIRDSIEPPKIGDKFSKFSSSHQAPSISSTHLLMNINPPLKETFGTDYGSDRLSLASHGNGNDNAMDVKSNACDLFTSKTGAIGIDDTKPENKKFAGKGKEHLTHAHVGDVIQASEVHVNRNFMLQNDGPTKEIKVGDDSSQYHKLDFDLEGDGVMHRESKALKHFRAALIEFVKELLKPTWRDGKLSKDAHKLIVKKSVDKVLSTLPAEHIPSIQESVDMYLSSSQPKLVKLVEGYIEKYGKL